MMMPLSLLVAHFTGDFVLQTDWMAVNKSKRNDVLAIHAGVYSLCFLPWGLTFMLLTFISHFATDFVTSRIASRLPNYRHWFFVAIGADQLIHAATLAATWTLLR